MNFKTLLTKTLLIGAALLVGTSGVWADHTTGVYETNLETSTGTVGETDKSSLFWNAHSMEYVIAGNGTFTVEFTNYGGASQWNNFVLVINNGIASYNNLGGVEYAVIRADNYGWGTYYDGDNFTNTFAQPEGSTNTYWVDYASALKEANVVMTITRVGTTVSMSATITPTDDAYSAWTYSWSNTMAAATGNVGFEFTTDASYMVISSATYTPADIVGLPTTYTSNFTATSMAPFAQTAGTVNTVNSTNCGYLLRAIAARNGTATATAYFDSDTSTGAYDAYALSDGEKITISFISYNGYYSYSETTKFAINNSDGTELVSYTYDPKSKKITDVSLGGSTAEGFEEFTAISYFNASQDANGFTDGSKPYLATSGYNTTVTITISKNGTVSINFNQSARSLDATFSKTLSDVTMDLDNITMTNAISGRDNNADRVMGIGNITISSETIYNYTVRALDGSTNVIDDNIASGTVTGGESVTVAYPQYVLYGTTLYKIANNSTGDYYRKEITPDADGYVYDLTYNNGTVADVVYYTEAEDITDFTAYSKNTNRASNGKIAHSSGEYKEVTSLSPGKYKVYTRNIRSNNNTHKLYVKCGDSVVGDFDVENGTDVLKNTDEFTVYTTSTLSVASEGSSSAGLDWLYVKKTGDASVSKSITSVGWATYCSPYALDLANATGLTDAYIVEGGADGVLTKTSVLGGTVPANTGLLLKGTEGTATIPVVASSSTDVSANKLVGKTESYALAAEGGYVLMATPSLGFYLNTNEFTVGANTAYLPANFYATAARFAFFSLDDNETTGIVRADRETVGDNRFYNLQGQRVAAPQKGLYIVDGKKVMVK